MPFKLICFALVGSTILIVFSCNRMTSNEAQLYKQLDSSLTKSNEVVTRCISYRMRSLQSKSTDPWSKDRAEYWLQKANSVQTAVSQSDHFIDEVRRELISKTGNDDNNISAVKQFFTDKKLAEIEQTLSECRTRLKNIEPTMDSILYQSLPIMKNSDKLQIENSHATVILTQLSKIRNDLKLSEYMLVEFCDLKIGETDGEGFYQVFSATVNTNGYRFHPGEKLVISTAMYQTLPHSTVEVLVKGQKATKNVNGEMENTIKVENKPGVYEVPMTLNYVDPNTGTPVNLKKVIRYTVEPRCP